MRGYLGLRHYGKAFCIALVAAVAGCASTPEAPITALQAAPLTLEKPIFQREPAVRRLLSRAETAYARGRYTLPPEDNAYDLFSAALMLDPDNAQAQAGLNAVLLAYVDHVRGVIGAGQLTTAQGLVARAEAHFPEAQLLQQLGGEIDEARAAIARKPEVAPRAEVLNGEKVLLPELELNARSEEVADILTTLAQRVRETNESVMIFARSDSEGRWIYKILQDAVEGYRVRGDIRISPVPAVVLMPPL